MMKTITTAMGQSLLHFDEDNDVALANSWLERSRGRSPVRLSSTVLWSSRSALAHAIPTTASTSFPSEVSTKGGCATLSMNTVRQSSVNVLDIAPTVLVPARVGNCEYPLLELCTPGIVSCVTPLLALHKMRVIAVTGLDLTKDNVILLHLVRGPHGFVSASVA